MLIIYNFGIKVYHFFIIIFSFFNSKAKKWIDGRKNWRNKFKPDYVKENIWFHFASLGEFEQGKPLLKAIREYFPDKAIVITFFSPSGYEVRKNSPLGDYILYLPIDSPRNAKDFIAIFKPQIAFFNKYEYWYYYFKELNQHHIPLYVTSAIFRPDQIFFKWYGGFNRKILSYVTHFFIQDSQSGALLKSIDLNNFTISGDTRFDSVLDLAKNRKEFPLINNFKAEKNLFIAGSTWPEDENLIANYIKNKYTEWKFIIAPHEISETKLLALEKLLDNKSVRYSVMNGADFQDKQVVIIDNIGMLSSLYSYGNLSYIGGGFGAGIHNTLEAAAWGLPVIFGPKFQKFKEAKDLIAVKGGFTISSQQELNQILDLLINDENHRITCGNNAAKYVEQHTGATEMIMKKVFGF
ncbi:MAG: glycosyltransferase N-terminal domain-containing protein [Pelobium sp.]